MNLPNSKRGEVLVISGVVALSVAVGVAFGLRGGDGTSITFLSVGQGDCTVIRSGETTVLVDAGPISRGFDAGSRIVIPKLQQMGVREINVLILTHPDSDHVGGVTSLLKTFPSTRIAISDCFRDNREIKADLQKWRLRNDQVWWLKDFQNMTAGNFRFEIRCPQVPANGPANDGSVFVRVSAGDASAVLTGDAPVTAENEMIARSDWQSDIMKAGHHGSRTSTGDRWVAAVRPKVAIISCGRDNRYGHPHREVVERLKRAGIPMLRTDESGDIRFELLNDRLQLVQ